jgi:hypothetical protein
MPIMDGWQVKDLVLKSAFCFSECLFSRCAEPCFLRSKLNVMV